MNTWIREEVLERIYLYGLLRNAAKRLFPPSSEKAVSSRWRPGGSTYRSNSFWSRTDYPPFALKARDVSLETLERIRKLCDQMHAPLLIVTIPYREQVYFANEFREGYDVSLPQKYVEQFAADHALSYLDLRPALADHVRATGAQLFFPQEGHFNGEGHAVTGRLLVPFFKAAIEKTNRN